MVVLSSFRVLGDFPHVKAEPGVLVDEFPNLQAIIDDNSKFRVPNLLSDTSWMQCDHIVDCLQNPFFVLPLISRMPKNGFAYTLGSLHTSVNDDCSCDFVLARNNQTGIAANVLSIDIKRQPSPNSQTVVRVGMMTKAMTFFRHDTSMDPAFLHWESATEGRFITVPAEGSLLIRLGWLEFRLWVPQLTAEQDARRRGLAHDFGLQASPNERLDGTRTTINHHHHQQQLDHHRSRRRGTHVGKNTYTALHVGKPNITPARPFFPVFLMSGQPQSTGNIYSAWEAKSDACFNATHQIPSHPNIYSLLDFVISDPNDAHDNVPWVIGKLIPSSMHLLSTLLRQASYGEITMATEKRVLIFRQVCAAISHAHTHNVAHGSLDSGYVLVGTGGIGVGLEDLEVNDVKGLMERSDSVIVAGFREILANNQHSLAIKHVDTVKLGQIGVQLLVGSRAPDFNETSSDVQPLLQGLLYGQLTPLNATHMLTRLLVNKYDASF
ncbi:hypothetical protein QBC38DRAFT_378461 [Podospora fimiseda]|uniref:Protein kinase domain-containing protein n=1 Tax=Podospora fimiseda TaxID=252190 RepID=A0AAN7BEE3_9PEZI|nr:hypothetical protein QBC38DRAFT_378461 [Podospora fimiseda]